MSYLHKFFFIFQISYWLHAFPELYFQKVKRDELFARATQATLYLTFFSAAYFLDLTRIALALSFLHYWVEATFHVSRLLYFADKTPQIVRVLFRVWNIEFVLVRLASITLAVLTFWYGLASVSASEQIPSHLLFSPVVRINCLIACSLLQAYLMWNFINFHLKRMREKAAELSLKSGKSKSKSSSVAKTKKQAVFSDLPEVDQQSMKQEVKKKK